ncbi:DNA repair helicase XPB [Tibeticola sp.]|uniref:DNA repair helicase XPB n=1 Tax=Tibeticola sp. TaxID=2005368 RepID=UPI002582B8EE|nr:DNA repair helicase XPB [Tibeticola sp.]MCI4440315.1 DEAD/DEAH box helicase [Tibeticola sp.]
MAPSPDNALIVQSDCSVLLDVHAPRAENARAALAPFAELAKSPEHVHTFRLTPLSIWNARAAGLPAERMVAALHEHARYPVPPSVEQEILELAARYGRVVITRDGVYLRCTCLDELTAERLARDRDAGQHLAERIDGTSFRVDPGQRGVLKQALLTAGFPADDLAGYVAGEAMEISLRECAASGAPFVVREYQRQAAESFYLAGSERGGSGVIVLPCGAGKTIVGLVAIKMVGQTALVLTTSLTSVKQWRRELLDKTSLRPDDIAEYTGEQKSTGPVTLTTYQILTWRANREGEFPHLELFRARSWGLILYDEVHLLPAPVFRATADLQARRRMGLTATLVREDGREADVFALIGPKRFDVPWKDLERQAWIASATCVEERVPMSAERRMEYALADRRSQFRIAAENPAKMARLRRLLDDHRDGRVLIIGEYIAQVEAIAKELDAPLVTGKTPQSEREQIYDRFRRNELHCIVLSKVGNFAIDLPDADVLIQVSGMFGSRQEEAQRLGRILRPKSDGRTAHFFTLVSRDTREEEFAHHRKLFLTEQGYSYQVVIADDR